MGPKKFYRFAYYSTPEKRDRSLLLHQLRDGDAALELSEVLRELGYQYGGLLLNYPGTSTKRRHVNSDFLTPNDLLVLNTRPPLDDEFDRRRVCPSYTDLEEKVFAALKQSFFAVCSRSHIRLHSSLPLSPDCLKYRSIELRVNRGAYSVAFSRVPVPPTEPRTSPAFMVFKEHAWQDGPGILCVFGVGGPETLIINHLVRKRQNLRRLVCRYEFVLIELQEQSFLLPQDNLTFLSSPGWATRVALKLLPTNRQ
jgi:hypothetical protein